MISLLIFMMLFCFQSIPAQAESATETNERADLMLADFHHHVTNGDELVKKAKAVLVLPRVYRIGLMSGNEHGEGVLRINGKTEDYYLLDLLSNQLAAQRKSIILLFMQDSSLAKFRSRPTWKITEEAALGMPKTGKQGFLDIRKLEDPVIGFVIGRKGLIYDLSLAGAVFTRMKFEKEIHAEETAEISSGTSETTSELSP
ncbi:MAG: hypothetical protein PHW04_03735 [Candidatus Wallbacteria bacterium]|nr:hypothetical protein [Candidatus Wallbacteria bacterium]